MAGAVATAVRGMVGVRGMAACSARQLVWPAVPLMSHCFLRPAPLSGYLHRPFLLHPALPPAPAPPFTAGSLSDLGFGLLCLGQSLILASRQVSGHGHADGAQEQGRLGACRRPLTPPGSAQLGQDELPRHRAACQPPEWPLAVSAPVTARCKFTALSLPRPPSLQPAPTLSPAMAAEPANIPALVQRLRSSRAAEQLAAAKELGRLVAASPENKAALVAAGGAAALVQLLGSGRRPVREAACETLAKLAFKQPAGKAAVAAAGGIPAWCSS